MRLEPANLQLKMATRIRKGLLRDDRRAPGYFLPEPGISHGLARFCICDGADNFCGWRFCSGGCQLGAHGPLALLARFRSTAEVQGYGDYDYGQQDQRCADGKAAPETVRFLSDACPRPH